MNAVAKVKRCAHCLKVGDANGADFLDKDMLQYIYGKGNARRLNFCKLLPDGLEDADSLFGWARRSLDVVLKIQR